MAWTLQEQIAAPSGRALPYVLMYHSVAEYAQDPYRVTVDPARFERQLRWLERRGLRGVSMGELMAAGDPRGLVGLTFDDGYQDFMHHVVPALRRHGFTATVFVIAGRLGGSNVWDPDGPRKPLMTSEQVEQAVLAGMEIGSHGMLHRRLSELDDDELVEEVAGSREVLRALSGQDVGGFCYPYGDLSRRVRDAVRDCGYDYGCAIWSSPLTGRHALPRTYVGDSDGHLRLLAKRVRHEMGVTELLSFR
ncbi:polysaccharide deacetylase family protein [Saccharopolyspora erythraea]|uniref:polysaccharide deacetylase family protein n=1 Tax=Saccharopolyspora erythraea TaxID=1836 RepID=UPI001BADD286|nr:polysaccharide deacetylase family protein [Saccharopolyspora erythraea]QUH02664.1 polysaccharide deacetylase family protein [Saccharopolyspora erythraea]